MNEGERGEVRKVEREGEREGVSGRREAVRCGERERVEQ